MNLQEAIQGWGSDRQQFEALGAIFPDVQQYIPDGYAGNFNIAMDAQPQLMTAPNSGIPAFLTTMIDPSVFEVLFTPTKAAEIFGEVKKGDWTDQTAMFPVVEHAGEVSSYGDFNNNGHVTVNANWPQRQAYLYQTIEEYGDLELDRAGVAKINWVTELNKSAATIMNRYQNFTYFFGVAGLQNFGALNDPSLQASLTPAPKAGGGNAWVNGNGVVIATANEIFNDILACFYQLVSQSGGLVDNETKVVLALSPGSKLALNQTNSFGLNVYKLLKENFPNIRIVDAVQYGARTVGNPQGIVGGNFLQLIAVEIEGQQTGFSAFNEKMRMHRLIPGLSSYSQKITGGTWGTVIRMPIAVVSMIGI